MKTRPKPKTKLPKLVEIVPDMYPDLFNIPGVAGAVLQTALSLINSISHPLVQNIEDTFTPKP